MSGGRRRGGRSAQSRMLFYAAQLGALALLGGGGPAARADGIGPSLDVYLDQVSVEELSLSPSGDQVAFVTRLAGEEGWEWEVWWLDLETSDATPRRLAAGGPSYGLGWRPITEALSFVRQGDEGEELVLSRRGIEPAPVSGLPGPFLSYEWLLDGRLMVAVPDAPPAEGTASAAEPAGILRRRSPPVPGASRLHRVLLRPDGGAVAADEDLGSVPVSLARLRVDPEGRRLALVPYPEPSAVDPYVGVELAVVSLEGELGYRTLTANAMREGIGFLQPGLAWSADGREILYWAAGREDPGSARFTQWRLYRIGAAGGSPRRIAPGFEGSFEGLEPLPDGSILTAGFLSTHKHLYRIRPSDEKPEDLTPTASRISLFAVSADGARIAMVWEDRRHFEEIRIADGLEVLAAAPRRVTGFHAALEALSPPEVETIRWDNGEGDVIEGVLHWPPGRRGARGLPLVVDLHGGPWLARTDSVGLSAPSATYPTLLAWRGYLVLAPNFRGSAGRGDAFLQAVQDHACSRPVVDVVSGVESLVRRGWADPARVAAMGHSFGGTLANCLATRSDHFAAVMTDAGAWDFVSEFGGASLPFDWGFLFSSRTPWGDPETYWRESPLAGAAALATPTLVTFGEKARTTPLGQAFELFRALEVAGTPARLLLFPGESVLIGRRDHQRVKLEAELAWLERWIGRGAPPAGD